MKEVRAYMDSNGQLHTSRGACASAELRIIAPNLQHGDSALLVGQRRQVIQHLRAVDFWEEDGE